MCLMSVLPTRPPLLYTDWQWQWQCDTTMQDRQQPPPGFLYLPPTHITRNIIGHPPIFPLLSVIVGYHPLLETNYKYTYIIIHTYILYQCSDHLILIILNQYNMSSIYYSYKVYKESIVFIGVKLPNVSISKLE